MASNEKQWGKEFPLMTMKRHADGSFVITSPAIPELVTEGKTVEEAITNLQDCITAVLDLYERESKTIPDSILE